MYQLDTPTYSIRRFLSLHSNKIFLSVYVPLTLQSRFQPRFAYTTSSVITGIRGAKADVSPPRSSPLCTRYFHQNSPRERFFILDFFQQDLATTGIHRIVCTGTGHRGQCFRGNRPLRDVAATMGIYGGVSWICCPEMRLPYAISPDVNGPFLLLSVYSLIINTFACTMLDVCFDIGCKHCFAFIRTQQQQKLSEPKKVIYLVHYSISQPLAASKLSKQHGRPAT